MQVVHEKIVLRYEELFSCHEGGQAPKQGQRETVVFLSLCHLLWLKLLSEKVGLDDLQASPTN